MQTESLTLLQAAPSGITLSVPVMHIGTAPPQIDFGALLLTLLSAGSAPPELAMVADGNQPTQMPLPEIPLPMGLPLPADTEVANSSSLVAQPTEMAEPKSNVKIPWPVAEDPLSPNTESNTQLINSLLLAFPSLSMAEPGTQVSQSPPFPQFQQLGLALPEQGSAVLGTSVFPEQQSNQTSGIRIADYAVALPGQPTVYPPPASQVLEVILPGMESPTGVFPLIVPMNQPANRPLSGSAVPVETAGNKSVATENVQSIEALFPGTEVQLLKTTPPPTLNSVQAEVPISRLPQNEQDVAPMPPVNNPSGEARAEVRVPVTPQPVAVLSENAVPSMQDAAVLPQVEHAIMHDIKSAKNSWPTRTETNEPLTIPPGSSQAVVSTDESAAPAEPDPAPRVQFVLDQQSLRPPLRPAAEILLRLQPDTLGTVRLQLRTIENHLAARVVVQTEGARHAVEGNLPELQRTLAEAGLVIDRFEVTVGHTAGSMHADPDASAQKRRYAPKPKTNRRYQEAAGVQKAATTFGMLLDGVATGGYGQLNMMM